MGAGASGNGDQSRNNRGEVSNIHHCGCVLMSMRRLNRICRHGNLSICSVPVDSLFASMSGGTARRAHLQGAETGENARGS